MTTPAGWYHDPSGVPGQRYFDGTDWTEQRHSAPAIPLKSDAARAAILDRAVMQRVGQGGRVESRTQFQAVIVYGRPVNQVVHAILTIFTCFLWAIIWLIANSGNGGERREVIQVDPYGELIFSSDSRGSVVAPPLG